MTTLSVSRPAVRPARPRLAGFPTLLGKELTDWVRGRRAIVVGIASVGIAVLTTLVPFLVRASASATTAAGLSLDPTDNVLIGWSGTNVGIVLVLATMGLLAIERDRGTLAWTASKPVSRSAILAAKWVAAFIVLGLTTVAIPVAIQVVVATIAYGALPDLGIVTAFGLLFLTVPAFYATLTIGLGTVVQSTAGVAGAAFLAVFGTGLVEALVPAIGSYAPTNIHRWVLAVVQGIPAPGTIAVAWAVSIAALAVIGRVAFDREEL